MNKQRLHTVAKIIAGQSPTSSTYNTTGDGLPFFQGKADFQEKYPQVRVWCNSGKRKEAEPGDILMSVRAPVGSVNICNQKSIIGRGLSAIRPLSSVNGEFLYYFLKSNEQKIANLGTGSTFKAIAQETLKKIEIPVPPIGDQNRIAHLLGNVEGLIGQRKQHLQQLDYLLRSVFLKMFGDPMQNEKGWEKKTAIDYATCIVPGRDKPKGFTGNTPWVTTNDLFNLSYTYTSQQGIGLSCGEIDEVRARIIPAGSVLITCVGDLGVTSICGRDMVVNQQLHAFQVSDKMNNVFFMFSLSFQKSFMYRNASKTTVPYMNKTVCNSIPMIKPPIDLQNQFAAIFDKIEKVKSHYQQSLAELKNLYGVLSQKAFKGELDLSRVVVASEHLTITEDVKLVIPVPTETEPKPAIKLPAPDDLNSLTGVEGRKTLIGQWLGVYLGQLGDGVVFFVEEFIEAAQQRLRDLQEDEVTELGLAEYDYIKDWVFRALESCRLTQNYPEGGNWVRIVLAKEQ